MCCRVSEEVIKEDTVILLVETYVLTVELNDKITELLQPVFNLFSLIESKMLTENTLARLSHTASVSVTMGGRRRGSGLRFKIVILSMN